MHSTWALNVSSKNTASQRYMFHELYLNTNITNIISSLEYHEPHHPNISNSLIHSTRALTRTLSSYHECARTLCSGVCIVLYIQIYICTYIYICVVGFMNAHKLYFLMCVFVLHIYIYDVCICTTYIFI